MLEKRSASQQTDVTLKKFDIPQQTITACAGGAEPRQLFAKSLKNQFQNNSIKLLFKVFASQESFSRTSPKRTWTCNPDSISHRRFNGDYLDY